MTTALPMSPTKNDDAEFAYAGEAEYVSFLCGQGYNATTLKTVTGDKSSCSSANNATVWELNYPSFALSAKKPGTIVRKFKRTVTNVGEANSVYKA
ncbi:cucumisin-like protein, partial [Tanacetum coccineum]